MAAGSDSRRRAFEVALALADAVFLGRSMVGWSPPALCMLGVPTWALGTVIIAWR
jgi:hypothetical protein